VTIYKDIETQIYSKYILDEKYAVYIYTVNHNEDKVIDLKNNLDITDSNLGWELITKVYNYRKTTF
jgi:hypothetical protein